MKSETSDLEKFLTNKLESEIAAFGDGVTEFHTRDLEALLELIENKNKEIERLSPKEEYILCAAVWFHDGIIHSHQPINIDEGFVVCGRRHHNCFTIVKTLSDDHIRERIKNGSITQLQGFLTNKNRFVDREIAAEIAFNSGQISEERTTLYSEDFVVI